MIISRITVLRVFQTLPVLTLLFLITACPPMGTTSLGGGSPLEATRDEKAATEKAPGSEEPVAPLAGSEDIAFRDGGILSAPSGPERLEDPDYALRCNLRVLRLAPTVRWRNAEEFLTWLRTATSVTSDVLALIRGGCDLMAIAPTDATATRDRPVESGVKEWYAAQFASHSDVRQHMGPGRYLFYRSVDDRYEEYMSANKTFANLEELKSFALDDPAKSKYIGEIFVSPVLPMLRDIDPNDLLPTSPVRGLRPDVAPMLLDPITP